MLRVMMMIGILMLIAIPARAQEEYPVMDIFGGYSYYSQEISADNPFNNNLFDFFDDREGTHGVGFSVSGNFTRHLGVVADFSYNKKELDFPFGGDVDFSNFLFLFGPRFTARGGVVEGFGHALFGGIRRKVEDFDSDVDFAMGFGGGLDVKLGDNFAIRAVQVDYIPVRSRDIFTRDREWDHNVRVQVGATFRWNR